MPSVSLYTTKRTSGVHNDSPRNNLPPVLHTPSGLAILEIQGTIHAPLAQPEDEIMSATNSTTSIIQTPVGRLEFPLYSSSAESSDLKWMKKVYLYVGKHQRLTGEVKKLPKPLVVVGKRAEPQMFDQMEVDEMGDQHNEELEILEIIRHKILFGGRPEPVGD